MRDLASRTNLSVMTVSNVLNGKGRVSKETSLCVLAAVREMGFRRDLSLTQTKIAFNAKKLVDSSNDAIHLYRDIYFNVLELARLRGWTLSLTDNDSDLLSPDLSLANLVIEFLPPGKEQLENIKVPRICAFFEMPGAFCVLPDNESVGRMAAELLVVKQGLRRIVTCFESESLDQMPRGRAFIKAASNLGAEIVHLPTEGGLIDALSNHFAENPGWTQAIFALSGHATMTVHAYLSSCGMSIPKDVGLLGFDDFSFYKWLPLEIDRFYFSPAEIASALINAADLAMASETSKDKMKIITPIHYRAGKSLHSLNET